MAALLLSTLITALLFLYPLWRIFARAGLNPLLSLLVLVPYLGPIVVTIVLAFAHWPNTDYRRTER